MGKHRAVSGGAEMVHTAPQPVVRVETTVMPVVAAPEPSEGGSRLPWYRRWFKNDWVWLVSFVLGFGTGLLLLYAGFLLWLTGDLTEWLGGLF